MSSRISGRDGVITFDGSAISIEWTRAARAKAMSGPRRVIPLAVVVGVELESDFLHVIVLGRQADSPDSDPFTVLTWPGTHDARAAFADEVRHALENRDDIDVQVTAADRCRFEAHVATQGRITVVAPDATPDLPEIREVSGDDESEDRLVAAALRWAADAGTAAVVRWVADWPNRRDIYERQGFALSGRCRDGSIELHVVLRPSARFWWDDIPGLLGPLRPDGAGWTYSVRGFAALGQSLVALLCVFLAGVDLRTRRFYPPHGWPSLLPSAGIAVVILALLFAFWFTSRVRRSMRALMRAAQMSSAPTAAALVRARPRSPVLYLRSFADDAWARQFSRPGAFTTEEDAVAAVVTDIGPFVGLDRAQRNVGAAMGRVADSDWRPAVIWLLSHARLVIMRAGTGESLRWELQQAIRLLHPRQLLILVPNDAETYRTFAQSVSESFPNPLPQLEFPARKSHDPVGVLCFGDDWRPELFDLRMRPPWRWVLALDTRLGLRLRRLLAPYGGVGRQFWARRIAATVASIIFIVGVAMIGRIGLDMGSLMNQETNIRFPAPLSWFPPPPPPR